MKEERIAFNVIQDDFSIFEIENGQILKAKSSIIDIVNFKNDEPAGRLAIQPFSAVITPENVDKYDIEYTQGQTPVEEQVKELKFTEIKNTVNIYETKTSIIILVTKIEKISLTNKMDKQGNPIIRYTSNNTVRAVEKPFLDNNS